MELHNTTHEIFLPKVSQQDSRFNYQFIGNMIGKHVKWHHRTQLATI